MGRQGLFGRDCYETVVSFTAHIELHRGSHGEGSVVKIKKRKIEVKDESSLPPVVGLFESFTSELRVVKELMEKLPQGPGESYVGPRSYVPQSDFDAYLVDQRKQKAQLANLEKGYASLA
ncbi:hypothetical protein KY290_008073 [Solanum tuberosum]|uniref:Uncharacterized protein n=1 Tax=Solanum tuberosum TaxID=4113 RepID=A0ABQ7W7D8_SOLTU|nr:hypothetical protein KY290_008073 [Solanum tuberosum]